MKVYTRTGDRGTTSLFSGGRVAKDDVRIEAYGTLDELSSVLGLLLNEPLPAGVSERVVEVQETLFAIGSVLADKDGKLSQDPGAWAPEPLEAWIDAMDEELEPLRAFILPGGCRTAAVTHLARAVCRRGERRVQTLAGLDATVVDGILPYLNRLSDALFVLARFVNARMGVTDVQWRSD